MTCNDNVTLWKFIREPFVVPMAIHRCAPIDFENIDVDVAGCRTCGGIHRCADEKTCVVSEHGGHRVCEITGCCIRHKVFSSNEYVDTVSHVASAPVREVRNFNAHMIAHWVHGALHAHAKSLQAEQEANVTRRTLVFSRIVKHYKISHKPLNLVEAFTCLVNATSNLREPVVLEPHKLQAVADLCVAHITHFCSCFSRLKYTVPSTIKMQGFIIGVLYLMRRGVFMYDTIEVVPRVPQLEFVLPIESSLKHSIGITTRVMTETENLIKKAVKNLTIEQLHKLGF